MKIDLFKIGVFLGGISVFLIAVWMIYITSSIPRYEPHENPFYARCTNGVVIVSANRDISNVTVLDLNREVLCSFSYIPKGSDDFCNVSDRKLVLVRMSGYQKVVECYYERTLVPVPAKID